MLSRYRRSNALMSMGYSKLQTITLLIRELNISEPQAYAILRDSIQLYGDVNKVDKEGMRHIFYENYMLAASLARKKEDYNAMNRALDSASEILVLKIDQQTASTRTSSFLVFQLSCSPRILTCLSKCSRRKIRKPTTWTMKKPKKPKKLVYVNPKQVEFRTRDPTSLLSSCVAVVRVNPQFTAIKPF